MKPTDRESVAAQRLAEALVEFMIAHEEGRIQRQPKQPRDEIRVRVEQALTTARRQSEPSTHEGLGGAPRLLLTAKDAAKYLSISERMVWALTVPRGPLPVVRLGRTVRYPVADLDAAIEGMRINTRKDRQR